MRCIHDHAIANVQDFNPDHIILHSGSNSGKTSSQIAREIIDLALSLKSDKNKASVPLLTPQSNKWNNKASEQTFI